jgi:hypothetical protein
MPTTAKRIKESADGTMTFEPYRGMPIFGRTKINGAIEYRCNVPTISRNYSFKADSLDEIHVKIDIALDTP